MKEACSTLKGDPVHFYWNAQISKIRFRFFNSPKSILPPSTGFGENTLQWTELPVSSKAQ
jgi:hypothetical protein